MAQATIRTPSPKPITHPIGTPQTRRRWTISTSSEAVKGFVRRLTVRRQPFRQRERSPPRDSGANRVLPSGQESSQTVNLQNTSFIQSPDVDLGGINQHCWCLADNQLQLAGSGMSAPEVIDVEKHATGTYDTAEGVERRTGARGIAGREEPERPTTGTSKTHSFPSTTDLEGEERVSPLGGPTAARLRRKKSHSRTRPSFSISRFKRTNSKTPKSTLPPSTVSLGAPSPGRGEHHQSIATQPRDQDPTTTTPQAGVDQQQSADPEKAERIAAPSDLEEVENLRRDLATSQSRVAELQKRCEAQSKDLECTNDFLNTADKSSDSDIIQALQRLNAEVQQDTTYMAEWLVQDFEFKNIRANPTKEQISARQKVSASIGHVLVQSLGITTPEELPMLLQIASQAFLVSALCETASSWAVEPGQNTFIDEIYQRLRRVEAQAISGRWRSLTRVHIVRTCLTDPSSLVREILSGISAIVVAAGCTASQAEIMSTVSSRFEKKVFSLVSLAGRLNKMFDDVISSDFEVFVVRAGEKFEGKKMEDTDGSHDEIQKASVLCATHLGLIKQVPVGTLWEKGKKQKMMVLKAKVLLESFLTAD